MGPEFLRVFWCRVGLGVCVGVEEALDLALKVDATAQPGAVLAEAVEALQRIQNKLHALDAAVTGAFDASGEWAAEGDRNTWC